MSYTYAQVTIIVYEPVADKNIFEKSLLQRERNLITFVERFEIHNIMDRTTIEDAVFPDCPIRNILAKLCDKWSLLVIYTLNKAGREMVRFKELQREIPDISQKMLTVPYPLFTAAYQCVDRVGAGKQGRNYKGQEENE